MKSKKLYIFKGNETYHRRIYIIAHIWQNAKACNPNPNPEHYLSIRTWTVTDKLTLLRQSVLNASLVLSWSMLNKSSNLPTYILTCPYTQYIPRTRKQIRVLRMSTLNYSNPANELWGLFTLARVGIDVSKLFTNRFQYKEVENRSISA